MLCKSAFTFLRSYILFICQLLSSTMLPYRKTVSGVCLLFWPAKWILRLRWFLNCFGNPVELAFVDVRTREAFQEDLVDYRGAITDSGKNTESGMQNIKRWVRIRQTPQYLGAVQVFSGWNRQEGQRLSSWTNSLLVRMKLVRGFRRWIKTSETPS